MEWLEGFIIQNFILLAIATAMLLSAFVRYKQHPKISIYTIVITIIIILLAVFLFLENYGKTIVNPTMTLIFSVLGYTFRPLCLYLFLLLGEENLKQKEYLLYAIPLFINALVYLLAFFPATKELVIWFSVSPEGKMSFEGGFLRYTSHIVGALYLVLLLIATLSSLKFKRLMRSLVVIGCSALVVLAVVVESFFNNNGDIYLLNTVIGVCTFIYYLYLNIENNEIDEDTGLYKGETYNVKIEKTQKNITGVIVFKVNINDAINGLDNVDEYEAYSLVAKTILKSINRKMVAFRQEYDKFILVIYRTKEAKVYGLYESFKDNIIFTECHVDIGYAYRENVDEPIHQMVLRSERMISINKNDYRDTLYLKRR